MKNDTSKQYQTTLFEKLDGHQTISMQKSAFPGHALKTMHVVESALLDKDKALAKTLSGSLRRLKTGKPWKLRKLKTPVYFGVETLSGHLSTLELASDQSTLSWGSTSSGSILFGFPSCAPDSGFAGHSSSEGCALSSSLPRASHQARKTRPMKPTTPPHTPTTSSVGKGLVPAGEGVGDGVVGSITMIYVHSNFFLTLV